MKIVLCSHLHIARLAVATTFAALLVAVSCTGAVNPFSDQPTDLQDGYASDVNSQGRGRSAPLALSIHDNGMLHLVLHYLSLQLIRELETEEETMLNERQSQLIHDRITGFYDEILKHPALNSNRVAFSQKQPEFHKPRPEYSEPSTFSGRRSKRGTSGRLTEICRSVSGWEEEFQGTTRTRDVVDLFPNQHFYTTRCMSNGQTCNHIDVRTTQSECRTRSSWTIAYVANGSGGYRWEWIAIDTCCSCAASS